ncbi:MAG: hypothetical protein JWL90_1097 [Chthoniobacteraceae bacterium]|nr:hypothetical protein [Chthoniobacteraceae bacterium]
MNSDDSIESRLRRMRPSEPPRELMARLHAPRRSFLAYTIPFAAAAVVAFAFLFQPPSEKAQFDTAQPSDLRVFLPVETRSELVEVRDLGVIEMAAAPMRLVRYTWLDDVTYRDSAESTFRRASHREQIIPIALETY